MRPTGYNIANLVFALGFLAFLAHACWTAFRAGRVTRREAGPIALGLGMVLASWPQVLFAGIGERRQLSIDIAALLILALAIVLGVLSRGEQKA